VDNFIKQYARDFSEMDVSAITNWYEFPLSVLTPKENICYSNKEEFEKSSKLLLRLYRSFKFSTAVVKEHRTYNEKYGLKTLDVSWQLFDTASNPIIAFENTYFIKTKSGKKRIVGVISYNEFAEWQKVKERRSKQKATELEA